MKRILAALFVLAFTCPPLLAADAPPTKQGRLLFMGLAYDEDPPKGFTVDHYNWAPDNFSALLAAQSKELFTEIKTAAIKGKAATKSNVLAKFAALRQVARKGDVAFIYWGTHGWTTKDGWCVNLPPNDVIYGSEIRQELAKFQCTIVMVVTTCGSGGFAMPHAGETPLPPNVVAFCACKAKQSHHNQMDVSLLEALNGFGDMDGDGYVTLQEAYDYVPRRYRELFRESDDPTLQPVQARGDKVAMDIRLTKVNGTHAAVLYDGALHGATVLSTANNKSKVRFLGWDSTSAKSGYGWPDEMMANDQLYRPTKDAPAAMVEQGGAWYPAFIREKKGNGFLVHYIGYPDSDDEVVPRKRIRYLFGVRPAAGGAGDSPGGKGKKKKTQE